MDMDEMVTIKVVAEESPPKPGLIKRILVWLKLREPYDPHNVIVVGVNGMNQPILRGVEQRVSRKYVEALARGVVVTAKLQTDGTMKITGKDLEYPFTMLGESKQSIAWLEGILAEA